MSFPTLSWTEAGMSPGSKRSSSICTVMVGGVDGEGAGGKSDVERRRQSSCERCEEYVEHCRTGWFVVTNAQQWVAARLRFHTIGSPATGRSLPSIIQGYLVQNVFAKLPGAPALDPKRAPPLDTELPCNTTY